VRRQKTNRFVIDRQFAIDELLVINPPGCHQQGAHGLNVKFLLDALIRLDLAPGCRQVQRQHRQKHQPQNQPHFYTQCHGFVFSRTVAGLGGYFIRQLG